MLTPHVLQFGYGLSYSNFTYSDLSVSSSTPSAKDTVTVTVKVTNNSERDGKEVVQVYVKDLLASVAVPNIQLRGFWKGTVKAGQTETVSIDLPVEKWGLWDYEMKYVVEPGDFRILIGASSLDMRLNTTVTVA